jgi:alkanesulfonate monooxygenase SsuD/methylene tetrahydromethanopterin reductase-like flavin-dependent oxidoreductase (luciferase family)
MRIGVGYPFDMPASTAFAFLRGAEQVGVDTIWIYENPGWPGAFSTAGAVAALTSRVQIGIGTVSPYTRNPVTLAVEIAQLQALSSGRAVAGLGAGPAHALARWGIDTARPVAAMTETLDYLRRALPGQTVAFDGKFVHVEGVTLGFPTTDRAVPIMVGTIGARLSEMAGRLADGLIISNHAPLALVSSTAERGRSAAALAGRDPAAFRIVAYVPFSLRASGAEAHRALKPSIARTLARAAGNDALEAMYAVDGVLTADEIGHIATRMADGADPLELIPDSVVQHLCVSGDAEGVAARMAQYAAAGVDELVLFEVSTADDPIETVRLAVALAGPSSG